MSFFLLKAPKSQNTQFWSFLCLQSSIMNPKSGNNIETMLEMCSGTSNYPWITIWDIEREYFGRSMTKSEKNRDFWNYRGPPLRFVTVRRSRYPTPPHPRVGWGGWSRFGHAWGPKITFKKCPQLQSKSSETCSDTSLTLLGTSSTTLFMIMIGLGQYFVIFDFFGLVLVFLPPCPPTLGGSTVTVLRSRT